MKTEANLEGCVQPATRGNAGKAFFFQSESGARRLSFLNVWLGSIQQASSWVTTTNVIHRCQKT